jgi:hypothetical protein
MEYDAAQVKRMNATYMMISKALERGALTPRSALSWAARAGHGEDVSVIGALTGSESRAAQNRKYRPTPTASSRSRSSTCSARRLTVPNRRTTSSPRSSRPTTCRAGR